jgi:glycosyl transferase family 87
MVAPGAPDFNGSMKAAGERLAVRMRALGEPWEVAVFLWVPFLFFAVVMAADVHFRRSSLGDWEIFRRASLSAVHGHSPYPPADPSILVHNDKFVYPPITALLVSPLAALPDLAGQVLVLLLALGCVLLALRLLGVSDWRCYGLALLTAPVLDTVSLGALSSAMLLGVAAAWRYRDRPYVAAAATALTAVAKLFAWPLFVWLLATRRLRTAFIAAAASVVLLVGGWAAIGFAGLTGYPHLLRVLSRVEAVESYSFVGLFRLEGSAATVLTALLAVAVVIAVVLAARGPEGDRRALSVAVAGALLATPVLWLHYLVLLFVPIALARPRLSALWLAPLAFWVTPDAHSSGSVWRTCFALVVAALIVLRSFAPAASAAAAPRPGLAAPGRALPQP